MLDTLPPEIVEQILGSLPTASSIANVARTNRKLHAVVSADDYAVFREFVQRAFPSISTPPRWRDVACSLTSRSRAWSRRSFVARECYPPPTENAPSSARLNPHQKFGYIPVIDSYNHWDTAGTGSRKQVLAFGAAGRLRLRITETGRTEWKSFCMPDDFLAHNDILDIRLMRPHQHENIHGETLVFRRANGEVVRVASGVGEDNFTETSRYMVDGAHIDCMDVNTSADPLLAISNTKMLQLFPVHADSDTVRPKTIASFEQKFAVRHRKRCMKFLDDRTIAAGIQLLDGRDRAPILIYDVHPSEIVTSSLKPSASTDFEVTNSEHNPRGRHCANAITNLDNTASLASRPGQVFLSGWTDGCARLHDLRTPSAAVAEYVDRVDDGQILSLAAVGHERFFAGSHQNACLKFFDIRMPGARVYSHLDALPRPPAKISQSTVPHDPGATQKSLPTRDINIFLALTVRRDGLWFPLPRPQNLAHHPRYRGSIYSLSIPSPSSPTLFAGIQNHVIQLDFVNTDDVLRNHREAERTVPGLLKEPGIDDVLSLSCYERPREGYFATDPVLLRKQVDWRETVDGIDESQNGPVEVGWDHRWRLARFSKDSGGGIGSNSASGRGRGRGGGGGGGGGGGRWRGRSSR